LGNRKNHRKIRMPPELEKKLNKTRNKSKLHTKSFLFLYFDLRIFDEELRSP
jgi:hypothetical protein